MCRVKHLLAGKGSNVYSIDPDQTVLEALQNMAEHRIGALLVMRNEKLLGIISERDYARKVILLGQHSNDTPVKEIMSSTPVSVTPEESVEACMKLCTEGRFRHLPVEQSGRVVGVISIGDLVKAVIDDQATEIEQLQHYIVS